MSAFLYQFFLPLVRVLTNLLLAQAWWQWLCTLAMLVPLAQRVQFHISEKCQYTLLIESGRSSVVLFCNF